MILDAAEFDGVKRFNTDVCIIGGGVSGLVLARELLSEKRDVMVIEAGDVDFNSVTQQSYAAEILPPGFPDTTKTRLKMLGGSSNHWENSVERLDPIDFEKRDWVPDSGWPISYSEIEPYYKIAEDYCSVGADGYDPEYWMEELGFENICKSSEDVELAVAKSALPPTRFYEKYKPDLEAGQNLRIILNASAVGATFDRSNRTIKSIDFKSTGESVHRINAKIFCLCAGGIENARLLLSLNEKNNDAMGNGFSNVGRYLMEHPVVRAAHFYPLNCQKLHDVFNGLVDRGRIIKSRLKLTDSCQRKNQTNNLRFYMAPQGEIVMSHGIASSHALVESFKQGQWPDHFGKHLVNILTDMDSIIGAMQRDGETVIGVPNGDSFSGYQSIAMIEQTPDRENKVVLGKDLDNFGMKKIRIDWRVTDLDRSLTWKSLGIVSRDEALNRIGRFRLLREREIRIWGNQMGYSAHHIGTTRMHNSEKNGVVNSNCLIYGTRNFYIAGSSIFPTGGHVPPTLTIVALTVRLADFLKRQFN